MNQFNQYQCVVIKIGTSVITNEAGALDYQVIDRICVQLAKLHQLGRRVVVVSSGAVGAGRVIMPQAIYSDETERRQLLSAVGQVSMINAYKSFLSGHDINIAQVLLTKTDLSESLSQTNIRRCLDVLWKNKVIPIINENDCTAIDELMFTDNDELAGLVAGLISADGLVYLTNVEGFLGSNGVISRIGSKDDVSSFVQGNKSSLGRGGMISKITNAQKVADSGVVVHIIHGKNDSLAKLLAGREVGSMIIN